MANESSADSEKESTGGSSHLFHISSEPVVGAAQNASAQAANHDLGALPQSYGSDVIYLVARDPQQLFCYWDVDLSKIDAAHLYEGKWQISLRLFANGEVVSTTPADLDLRHDYMPAARGAANYAVELGYFDPAKNWIAIVRSNDAQAPSNAVNESSGAADFATIPLHLDFERLAETVESAIEERLPLGVALARLQGEGLKLAGQSVWSEEERALVARLLGVEMALLTVLSSSDIERWLRQELQRRIHSEGASGGAFGAEMAVSGGLSSAFGGLSSETLSSFGLSSAALARLGFSSEALSSFGLASASLSSPFGASWSAARSGERGFFMHVNAEVIFYGGTQPGSRVTIGGKEILLTANGTFSYHFKFPDGDFEMPIVATSPDGVETRSATLSFKRDTSRTGDVGATAQPHDLTEPPLEW